MGNRRSATVVEIWGRLIVRTGRRLDEGVWRGIMGSMISFVGRFHLW